VAQSYDEAVKWFRLAAAQDLPNALYSLAVCHAFPNANGRSAPEDPDEALRLFKRAAAKGHAGAAVQAEMIAAFLAATRAA
jgi:hypothetical protein